MTPAEELRSAAKLMRERAEAATPGPWERPLDVRYKDIVGAPLPEGEEGRYVSGIIPDHATGYSGRYKGQRERCGVVQCNTMSDGSFVRKRSGRDLDYIAGMHPLVALAVADFLDAAGNDADGAVMVNGEPDLTWCDEPGTVVQALRVARAYLETGARDA